MQRILIGFAAAGIYPQNPERTLCKFISVSEDLATNNGIKNGAESSETNSNQNSTLNTSTLSTSVINYLDSKYKALTSVELARRKKQVPMVSGKAVLTEDLDPENSVTANPAPQNSEPTATPKAGQQQENSAAKKRGRPQKVIQTLNPVPQNSEPTETPQTGQQQENSAEKRRGRPRKVTEDFGTCQEEGQT